MFSFAFLSFFPFLFSFLFYCLPLIVTMVNCLYFLLDVLLKESLSLVGPVQTLNFCRIECNCPWVQRRGKRWKLLFKTSALLFSIRRQHWLCFIYNTFISFSEKRAQRLRQLHSTQQKWAKTWDLVSLHEAMSHNYHEQTMNIWWFSHINVNRV